MAVLELTQSLRGKVTITVRDDKGNMLRRDSAAFVTDEQFNEIADTLDIDKSFLITCVDDFENAKLQTKSYQYVAPETQPFAIYVRPIKAQETASKQYDGKPADAFRKAIETRSFGSDEQPYIFWHDAALLCAVDLDVDDASQVWTERAVSSFLDHFQPKPFCAWITHGGGLRLVYHEDEGFTAEEIAAIAYLNLSLSTQYKQIELKKGTRHPMYTNHKQQMCGLVSWMTQHTDPGKLRTYLHQYDISDQRVDEWLDANSYERGKRYGHSRCPFNPTDDDKRQPVIVNDKGINCFVCESRGILHGSTKPGFFPYSILIGDTVGTLINTCITHFTHWNHAKHVFAHKLGIEGKNAELVYSAALKMNAGRKDDPRIKRAFTSGHNLIRLSNRWADDNGTTYTTSVEAMIKGLPVVNNVTRTGTLSLNGERHAQFLNPIDLSSFGYPHLTTIYGMSIYGQFNAFTNINSIPIVINTEQLASEMTRKFRPKYLPVSRRIDIDDAWRRINEICPYVNRQLIEMLIAAKGCAEAANSMPPMIFISGPTSTGKSTSVALAAAICGDNNTEVPFNPSPERIRQAIAKGKSLGTYVTFNEIIKESTNAKGNARAGMDFVLTLTPDSTFHEMYVGPAKLGMLPVLVWTDSAIPDEVAEDAQISRRLLHVHQTSIVDWERTIRNSINSMPNLRTSNARYTDACNAILSDVIDRFFTQSDLPFKDIASQLGFNMLNKSDIAADADDMFRDFFKCVIASPPLPNNDAGRWKGRGWKLIVRDQLTDLCRMWFDLCDESLGGKFTESRKCSSRDWANLMGIGMPVLFEIRAHGSKVAVRFISARRSQKTYLVNEELLTGIPSNARDEDD